MRPAVKQALEKKLNKAQLFIFGTSFYMEVIAAACIIIGIGITFLGVPAHLSALYKGGTLIEFLTYMFNIVIGIEILKMFCRHDLDSVVEVLLFAVARQMIIEHTSMVENLIGVIAIAVLFCTRKFLFVSALDKLPVFGRREFRQEEDSAPDSAVTPTSPVQSSTEVPTAASHSDKECA